MSAGVTLCTVFEAHLLREELADESLHILVGAEFLGDSLMLGERLLLWVVSM
jgi:hypothetical protein